MDLRGWVLGPEQAWDGCSTTCRRPGRSTVPFVPAADSDDVRRYPRSIGLR